MAIVLYAIDFPLTAGGLVSLMAIGGAVYFMGILAFDVMGMRTMTERWLRRRGPSRDDASDLSFDILIDEAAVEKIADDWNALFASAGKGVFGGYAWFQIWWRHLGKPASVQVHIVTARRHGRLVAILPLVVRRSGVLRVLEWAGHEVFDYGDVLAERAEDVDALWRYASVAGGYDIALIKDVHAGAASLETFSTAMHLRDQRHNYFLTLDFPSGEAWLAAQSRKLRGDVRRKTEKMQARGVVSFNVHHSEDLVPQSVIDALYAQKSAWFAERGASGVFSRPEVKNFLHDIAQDAAREGTLYLAWLTCGEAIVACHMGFVKNSVLHLYHTTYDAAFGAFSPGNAMMCETIKWAVDAHLRELDFMRGDEAYKQRFASGNRSLSAFIWGCSSLGKLAVRLRQVKAGKEPAVSAAAVEDL
jgi:CelD/BcsL family acetyltransferase involved in cellulose biosynthesis